MISAKTPENWRKQWKLLKWQVGLKDKILKVINCEEKKHFSMIVVSKTHVAKMYAFDERGLET